MNTDAPATLADRTAATLALGPPPDTLNNGDRLTQKEFHALYERMPEHVHAELIEGVVYMASPLRYRHGISHPVVVTLFTLYRGRTPGTQAADNATVILGDGSEPQPDALLRVVEQCGGRSRIEDEYVTGPPELLAEIADSSRTIDLTVKRATYARHGVLEYLVFNLKDGRLHGFDLTTHRERPTDADGVYRSFTFPGLWVNADAVFRDDLDAVIATLNAGLGAPEHAAFVAKLTAARVG